MGSYAQKSWLNKLAWDLDSPAWLSFLFGLAFTAGMCHYLSLAKEKAMRQPNKKSQKQTKPWYRKWWGVIAIVVAACMAIGIAASPLEEHAAKTEDTPAQTTPAKPYTILTKQQAGTTTVYYVYTDPSYRDQAKLSGLATVIYAELGSTTDYTVKLYDLELTAEFVTTVPQKDWKHEASGRDDYTWVAQHQFAVLTNNGSGGAHETLYYPNGTSGKYIEL